MTFKEWKEKYKPIQNPDSFEGDIFFETFGNDLQKVISQNPACIWTDLACNGYNWIENGVHFVNRLGYYVTEIPCEVDFLQVFLSTPEDEE